MHCRITPPRIFLEPSPRYPPTLISILPPSKLAAPYPSLQQPCSNPRTHTCGSPSPFLFIFLPVLTVSRTTRRDGDGQRHQSNRFGVLNNKLCSLLPHHSPEMTDRDSSATDDQRAVHILFFLPGHAPDGPPRLSPDAADDDVFDSMELRFITIFDLSTKPFSSRTTSSFHPMCFLSP